MAKQSTYYALCVLFITISLAIVCVNLIMIGFNEHVTPKLRSDPDYRSDDEEKKIKESYNQIVDVSLIASSVLAGIKIIVGGLEYWLIKAKMLVPKSGSADEIVLFERPKMLDVSLMSSPSRSTNEGPSNV